MAVYVIVLRAALNGQSRHVQLSKTMRNEGNRRLFQSIISITSTLKLPMSHQCTYIALNPNLRVRSESFLQCNPESLSHDPLQLRHLHFLLKTSLPGSLPLLHLMKQSLQSLDHFQMRSTAKKENQLEPADYVQSRMKATVILATKIIIIIVQRDK